MSAPIILVPGFWLGAWAWDEVAATLRDDGHRVQALTLPGLDPDATDEDRAAVHLSDHVDAIATALDRVGESAVLAVHSGAGVPGYAATDRNPDRVAAAVYVDSGPGAGALDPGFSGTQRPLPSWRDLVDDGSSIDGLDHDQLDRFRRLAVPEPAGPIREAPQLADPRRLDVPTTVVCTSMTSDEIRAAVGEGWAWLAGLAELHDVTYLDLPTGHWPMWSRPRELAGILGATARAVG